MTNPAQPGRPAKTLLATAASPSGPRARSSERPDRQHPRVPMSRVVAAAWHQHRSTLLVTSAAVVIASAIVLAISRLPEAGDEATSPSTVQLVMLLVDLYALGIGVFQAAPLLAREYEHQTHLFAWSQDVSPTRWLAGKAVLLLAVAVVSALLLGVATRELVLAGPATRDFAFEVPYFDASPLVQVGHVVFAFALGVALGLLAKRSVLAMSLTFVGFLAVRILVAFGIRPYYLPPVHRVLAIGEGSDISGGLTVDTGYLTSAGQPTALPQECLRASSGDFLGCLGRNDVAGYYLDSQPLERLVTFQLIEAGLALAAALILATLTWAALRRTTRG